MCSSRGVLPQQRRDGDLVRIITASIRLIGIAYALAGRPLSTDDAWTVEKEKFQLETGLVVSRQDNHNQGCALSLTLTYGLSDRMDLGIGKGYFFFRPKEGSNEDGFGDTEVKVKYRLVDERKWLPALAIAGKLKIPTASEKKGLGSGRGDFGLNAIATKKSQNDWLSTSISDIHSSEKMRPTMK